MADSILEIADLRSGYQKDSPILKGVSLHLGAREICTVIGPNGAGKSTVLKALYGLTAWSEGRMAFAGHSLAGANAEQLTTMGIGYVPQERNVFARLTVRENLELACAASGRARTDRIAAMMARYGMLATKARVNAGALSGGQRQILALAMALVNEPTLLLLDEPTAGLSPVARQEVFGQIRALRDSGQSILLVEQNAFEALMIADRAYVLVDGRNFMDGPAATLREDRSVRKSFLGIYE